mgnify:FL=1
MNYVKIYRRPKSSLDNQIIGVVNAKLLESLTWVLRPGSPPPDFIIARYEIHGAYYGSTADVDFVLTMGTLMSAMEGGPPTGSPADEFDTEAKRAKIMNIIVNGITQACRLSFTTPGTTVTEYYPPFDIGVDFVIESDPFAPAEEVLPPGEEFLDPGGMLEPAEPGGPGMGEGPFGGPGGPEFG